MHSKLTNDKLVIGVLLVCVVLLSIGVIYLNFALASSNSEASSLQGSVNELQSQLQSHLSTNQPQGNTSLAGLDPATIYATSNTSVVTVQGARTVSVATIFGTETSVESALGSGFVVDYSNSYFIVTNFHVVDSLQNMTVTFWNGDAYAATIVGSDPYSDIAVLKVNAPLSDLHPLSLTSSSSLRVGEPVVAIGNPFGLSGSVTFGIVSQVGRTIQYQSTTGTFIIADSIQFSAPINPGNSGGPLLDAYGYVLGITCAAVTGSQGVGFAIPSDTIARELPLLISTGKYNLHPYLGLTQTDDMTYQLAQAMGTNTTYGVLIEKTQPGGPVDKAGLKGGQTSVDIADQAYLIGGDIIVSVNGTRIVNYDSLATYLERHVVAGQTIQLGIVRSGQLETIQVVVGSNPSS
jgi:S1-C subfamily serine protease